MLRRLPMLLVFLLAASAARAEEKEIVGAVTHPETGSLHALTGFHRILAAYRVCDRLGTLESPSAPAVEVSARVDGRLVLREMEVALEGTFRSGARVLFTSRTVERIRALCHHRSGRGCAPHGDRIGAIYVDGSYQGKREAGTAERPFRTIGQGIAAAEPGQRVLVLPGVYAESVAMKDGVDLEGAGADVCVIDGGHAGSAVIAARARLSGFTIRGGSGTRHPWSDLMLLGGAVYVPGTSAVVEACVLRDCLNLDGAYLRGAALGAFEGRAELRRCVVFDNAAQTGTGFYLEGASPDGASLIHGNTFARCRTSGSLFIACVGSADAGHDIRNNIFARNDRDVRIVGVSEPSVRFNAFHENILSTGWEAVYPDNLEADPLFRDEGANDFGLREGSPCIDAGDPDPRFNDPDGSRADIGAIPAGGGR